MSAGFSSSAPEPLVRRQVGRPRIRLPVAPASSGDHAAIQYFLSAVFLGPTRAEFRASLEDPFYEPRDRLLIQRGGRIIAHALVTHRVMQFGSLQIPACPLAWLGVLPEFRHQGHGRRLLAAAEQHMRASGAWVGLLRTSAPHFFRRSGWALCGRHSYSRADARAVLARLIDRGLLQHRGRRLQIRPWRRWEPAALVRIYSQNLAGAYGPLERTEAYWQWLIRRQAYDQLYVALDGPGLSDLEETRTPIVGYAATQGETIVELMSAPHRRRALAELLARCCGDNIEHDRHSVRLCAPPASPLHKLFDQAGGVRFHHEADRGEVFMVRLLDPLKVLRRMCQEFHRRAEEAGLSRPLELGLLVEDKKYRLDVTRTGVRAVSRRVGRSYLRMNIADFTRLMFGQLDWEEAVFDRRLDFSTELAEEAGRALFPRVPLYRPQFDELPAQASVVTG